MEKSDFDFSIILNSRGRAKLLKNLFNSIKEWSANLDRIEVLVNLDDDDAESISVSQEKEQILPNIRYFIGPRPENLHVSINRLAEKSNGQYIFVTNDDVGIQTAHWDTIILDRVKEYRARNSIRDEILLISVSDNSIDKPQGKNYPSFPIISKKAVEVASVFMYEAFRGLGGDSSIIRLYEAINRVLYIPEVKLNHFYHSNIYNIVNCDKTAAEMRAKSALGGSLDPFTYDVSKELEKLRKYIESYKSSL